MFLLQVRQPLQRVQSTWALRAWCSHTRSLSSGNGSPDAFLYQKYADNLSDLQQLVRTIARLKGSSRGSQVVPREVVTAFCSRYSSMAKLDKQALLKSIAHTFCLTPAAVSAAHERYAATAASTSPAKVIQVVVVHCILMFRAAAEH
jgi:hypothetical protein